MKRIITIFLALFIGLSMSAQIQTKILGFTLGTTNKSTVLNQYKTKIKKASYAEDTYDLQNVEFAGYKWDLVSFAFHKGKLYAVYFTMSSSHTPVSIIDLSWNSLKNSLYNKYSRYYSNRSTSNTIEYSDRKTEVILMKKTYQGKGFLSLTYRDKYMYQQIVNARDIEL